MDFVREKANTLMQPNLSIADLRSMPIPVPPRREQDKIIEQLTELREETSRLVSLYDRKLDALV
ncbi:restriction endonuclease subunit S [Bradyrhizobium liaoningense]|uniref:restriction endonuclease subunit S n=1 Tax=Bradyrhizobium liaoningense TaxID=43992 RepID=UPI001BAC123D|nr:restriction endonuclease subunit S [Bradyrhizobium liaoningense]